MTTVAVVGAGHWGPNLIRIFHSYEDSRVRWVIDKDEARRAMVGARFPGVQVAEHVDIAIEDEEVDAIVIATPSSTHYDLARRALEGGKHVLVEKPIATSSREAEDLCRIAAERSLVLVVGHVFLFNQAIREAKRRIDSGDLGPLYFLTFVRTNLGPIRTDVSAVWDLAAHDISIANYLLDSTPERVSAVGGCWLNPGVDDVAFAVLHYPGGIVVQVHASWLNPRKVRDVTIVGRDVMLTIDDMNLTEPLRLYDKSVRSVGHAGFSDSFQAFRASIREGAITIPRVSPGEPLRTECRHFLDCVESGERPMSDGYSGLDVVRTLEAIDRSAQSGGAPSEVLPRGDS